MHHRGIIMKLNFESSKGRSGIRQTSDFGSFRLNSENDPSELKNPPRKDEECDLNKPTNFNHAPESKIFYLAPINTEVIGLQHRKFINDQESIHQETLNEKTIIFQTKGLESKRKNEPTQLAPKENRLGLGSIGMKRSVDNTNTFSSKWWKGRKVWFKNQPAFVVWKSDSNDIEICLEVNGENLIVGINELTLQDSSDCVNNSNPSTPNTMPHILFPGLSVIINDTQSVHFGKRAHVIDVYGNTAALQLMSDRRINLFDFNINLLKITPAKMGKPAIILRGPYAGKSARVLQIDDTACVLQVEDSFEIITLSSKDQVGEMLPLAGF